MKPKATFLSFLTLFLCLAPTVYSDDPKPNRPPGMPENELVAFDDFHRDVSSADLTEALGICHFDFQVQVPDGTVWLKVGLHLIENGKDSELGNLVLDAGLRNDSGKIIAGPRQFRVVLIVVPVDLSADRPLADSARLRIFAKASQSSTTNVIIIKNPLRNR